MNNGRYALVCSFFITFIFHLEITYASRVTVRHWQTFLLLILPFYLTDIIAFKVLIMYSKMATFRYALPSLEELKT